MEKHLYMEIVRQLEKDILSGAYGPSDMLPSENTLAAKFGVSRVTIRKSLDILKNDGLITSMHGKGYFIKMPTFNKYHLIFDGKTGSDYSRFQKVLISWPSDEIQRALGIPADRRVVEFHRVLERSWLPVAYDEKFIPYERGMPSVEIEINYAEFPELLSSKFSPFAIKTKLEIGMSYPPAYVANVLECPADIPLLTVYRYVCDRSGNNVGYGRQFLSPDFGRLEADSDYSLTSEF